MADGNVEALEAVQMECPANLGILDCEVNDEIPALERAATTAA
jgi:hypothetical protein